MLARNAPLPLAQRPVPVLTGDIGGWKESINFICVLSVVTNGWLFAFHSEMMENWGRDAPARREGAFIAFVSFVWLLQYIVRLVVPDVPIELQNIQARHASLVSSLVDGMTLLHDDSEQPISAEAFHINVHAVRARPPPSCATHPLLPGPPRTPPPPARAVALRA